MIFNLNKSQYIINGENGLPESYPIPNHRSDLLFYIQRNLNLNTIIYTANCNREGLLIEDHPIQVNWIKYSEDGKIADLNLIQKKAYGYTSVKINDYTYEISMNSYDKIRIFLHQEENGTYTMTTKIAGHKALLSNIYVYADEFGVFPQMKFIDLYGTSSEDLLPLYQRITI